MVNGVVNCALNNQDVICPARKRWVCRSISVRSREPNWLCRKRRHDACGRFDIEVQIGGGEIARVLRAGPAKREPIARRKAAVLYDWVAGVIGRNGKFFV